MSGCPMFSIFKLEATLKLWQLSYCEDEDGAHLGCERYKLSCRGASVPPNLLPNGKYLTLRSGKG